jgi:hypothetical protein
MPATSRGQLACDVGHGGVDGDSWAACKPPKQQNDACVARNALRLVRVIEAFRAKVTAGVVRGKGQDFVQFGPSSCADGED